jgi:hypothetical protein
MSASLVPVAAVQGQSQRGHGRRDGRPNAGFIAQLVATRLQAPQTRARRRAEPGEAVVAYRALGQWPSLPGRTVSRSL